MSGYTIIDLETTGLFPRRHDRVIEIGIVQLSDDGQVQDEWATLINPQRDVGPTHIHGITARDVHAAPTFDRVAPRVVAALAGRTLVAHNARFDTSFLDSEFERCGLGTRPPTPSLCTMELSSSYLRGASRKLRDCCSAAVVPHTQQHTAAGDARAVAGLMVYYLRAAGRPVPWSHVLASTRSHWWPSPNANDDLLPVIRSATSRRPDAWLDRITSTLPRNPTPAVESYLSVLEQVLLDGYLSAHEEDALVELAISLGLERYQLAAVHMMYVDSMAIAAWSDGVVTDSERAQLLEVSRMLGLPTTLVDVALSRAELFARKRRTMDSFRLTPGDEVVFTGELSVPRDQLIELVQQSGLAVGGVNKRTKLVVAADPDSLSGKAAKARALGIPVVTEAAFARMLSDLY
jgi:DNA polymerase-3 subunit epsilon